MPRPIEEMPPVRQDSLPWDDLLNGEKWLLERGADYECDESVVADRARNAARRRGLRVEVRISRKNGHVSICAH